MLDIFFGENAFFYVRKTIKKIRDKDGKAKVCYIRYRSVVGGVFISFPWALIRSVTHGQCNARPAVTFPVVEHFSRLTGTRL